MTHDVLEWLGIVSLVGLMVVSRLVRSLLVHQQKMTQMLQGGVGSAQTEERILRELSELRSLVAGQSLALEKIREERALLPPAEPR